MAPPTSTPHTTGFGSSSVTPATALTKYSPEENRIFGSYKNSTGGDVLDPFVARSGKPSMSAEAKVFEPKTSSTSKPVFQSTAKFDLHALLNRHIEAHDATMNETKHGRTKSFVERQKNDLENMKHNLHTPTRTTTGIEQNFGMLAFDTPQTSIESTYSAAPASFSTIPDFSGPTSTAVAQPNIQFQGNGWGGQQPPLIFNPQLNAYVPAFAPAFNSGYYSAFIPVQHAPQYGLSFDSWSSPSSAGYRGGHNSHSSPSHNIHGSGSRRPYANRLENRGHRRAEDNIHNIVDVDKIDQGMDVRTTIMLRNIPNKVNLVQLRKIVNEISLGLYDFMYLRIDFSNNCNVGYAFINFIDPIHIIDFANARAGHKWGMFQSHKVAEVSYATIQGRDCLIQKFRNSSVMLEPDHCRPKLYFTRDDPLNRVGEEDPFPESDNSSKLKRSCENAEHMGLYPPTAGAALRKEQRERVGIYDRGTSMAAAENGGLNWTPPEHYAAWEEYDNLMDENQVTFSPSSGPYGHFGRS